MRNDLGSTVLLTGTVDATILNNILNRNFWGQDLVPNFEFTTMKTLVNDPRAGADRSGFSNDGGSGRERKGPR